MTYKLAFAAFVFFATVLVAWMFILLLLLSTAIQ